MGEGDEKAEGERTLGSVNAAVTAKKERQRRCSFKSVRMTRPPAGLEWGRRLTIT